MRLLATDPGAERCGWAILESGPRLIRSGVIETPRYNQEFQQYRLALEMRVGRYFDNFIHSYNPDLVVNEIIPAVGGGNFAVATQSYLANCVVTCLHDSAFKHGIEVRQVSARSVQSKIAIRGKSKSITKVQVRNGVIKHLPELKKRLPDWIPDEFDAVAVGLFVLGVT